MAVTRYPTVSFKVNFEDDPLAPYDEFIQALGPLGYWRLNESAGTNADDGSPNNRDGTYTGGFTLSQTGALVPYGDSDNAVSFNGTTGYVDFTASSTWRNLTVWSLGAWIYPTATREADSTDACGILACDFPAADPVPWFLNYGRNEAGSGVLGSNVWAGFHTASGWAVVIDSLGEPPLNTYTHYIGTYDGTLLSLYRNFQLVASVDPSIVNAVAGADRKMYIGRSTHAAAAGSSNSFFPGRIDEPFILDYAMSAANVAKLQGSLSSPADKSTNYIDLSSRVRSFSFRRGRQDAVNRVEASDLSITLDNRDGALLPDPIINLLPNPSFEADQPFIPFTVVGGTKTRDTTHVQSGTYAAKFVGGASATTAYLTSAQGGLTAMRPGETYTFSAYVYLPSATGVDLADVTLEIVDEVSGSAASTVSSTPGSFNTFVRLSVTRTIRSNADASYCRVAFVTDVGGDAIWVDAVQLEQAASASTYADGDQTDCRWNGEPHLSLTHRKVAGSYRNIMPGRLYTFSLIWNAVTYPILKGQIDEWAYSYPDLKADAIATLRCTDGFRALSAQDMSGFGRPAETTGARIRAILRSAGVPESEIDVDDSFISGSTLSALTASQGATARSLIGDAEETEKGLFFIASDGKHTYHGSQKRSVGDVEVFKLKDDNTELDYSDIAARLDLTNVRNVTTITNTASGLPHAFLEPESVQRFFPITSSETSGYSLDIVSYVNRSTPYPFADGIQVKPARKPTTQWPIMLGLEIGDLGVIERVRSGRDLFQGFLQYLEGVEMEGRPNGPMVMQLRTSPVVQAPVPVSTWNSPISVPAMLTADRISASQASYTTASSTYTSGRLYVLFVSAHRSTTPAPATPTFTSTYTWTQIRSDTANFGSLFGRWGSFYTVTGSTVSEALIINFATNNPSFCQWCIFEISSGFDATPIASSNWVTSSASTMQADVGTLLDSQSVVLANAYKDGACSPTWPSFTAVYTVGAPNTTATTAAFGQPGLDTAVINWGTGEAAYCEVVEIDAA